MLKANHIQVFALLASILLAMGCSAAYAYALQQTSQLTSDVKANSEITLTALEDAASSDYGSYVDCKAEGISVGTVRVYLNSNAVSIRYGDCFSVKGTLKPSDFEENESLWKHSVVATVSCKQVAFLQTYLITSSLTFARNRVIDAINAQPSSDETAVIKAVVCGSKQDLYASQTYEDFKRCGLAHLVAVSGAHFAIVCGFALFLLNRFRARRSLAITVLIALSLCYLVISAAPISAIRSVIMSCLGLTSFFFKRRASTLNSIALCIFVIVATDPSSSVSLSFLLSALSTIGIVVFAPLLSRLFCNALPRLPRALLESLALTLSANLLTVLVSAATFSQIPLIAVVSNLAAGLLFPLTCVMDFLFGIAALTGLPLADVFFNCAYASNLLLTHIVGALAQLPYASIPASINAATALSISALAAIGLWAWWPKRIHPLFVMALAAAIIITIPLYNLYLSSLDEIIMLDVDQGDAFVIRSKGSCMLIDTGNHDSMLLSALSRHGITKLDAVLITHADDDHCGSLDALRQAVQVDTIFLAEGLILSSDASCASLVSEARQTAHNVRAVTLFDTITLGNFTLHVIWPETIENEGGNNDSVCLLASFDKNQDGKEDVTALFTGDAEAEAIESAIQGLGISDIDILKESHHGSRTGLTDELASELSPRISLISCGEGNKYGHPHEEVLEMLARMGTNIFRTDTMGDVSCKLNLNSIEVDTQR